MPEGILMPAAGRALAASAAGCFGKLPCVGDFVSRRLPRAFVQPWDAWLQRALEASRAQLGATWLDTYLASPFWRFALAPGLCGPDAWLGVLMPSTDRVGRTFPFTVAMPRPPAPHACRIALHARAWFEAVEALMLAALHPEHELARLDENLAALPALDAPAWTTPRRAWHVPLPTGERTLAGFGAALDGLARAGLGPHSAWITTGSNDVAASLLVCDGLPPEEGFASLLDGHWSDPAWGGSPPSLERNPS
jgi:type VI secretion system protein ImpM